MSAITKEKQQRDRWIGDVYIHYGKGYVVAEDCQTYCIGPVDAAGKPLPSTETPLIATDKPYKPLEPVAKIEPQGNTYPADTPSVEKGIMQHRGRPKKEGEVHRTTVWRRQSKAQQGVLL